MEKYLGIGLYKKIISIDSQLEALIIPGPLHAKILKHLTPKQINLINEEETPHLFGVSCTGINELDLKGCFDIKENDVLKLMNPERAQNITYLSLEGCSHLNNQFLKQTILKCVNLRKLNVIRCCLHPLPLMQACSELKNLSELHWSMDEIILGGGLDYYAIVEPSKKLTKLEIRGPGSGHSFYYINFILQHFPNLEQLHLHFWEIKYSHLTSHPKKFFKNFKLRPYYLRKLNSLVITSGNLWNQNFLYGITKFLDKMLLSRDSDQKWASLVLPNLDLLIRYSALKPELFQQVRHAKVLAFCESHRSSFLSMLGPEGPEYLEVQGMILDSEALRLLGRARLVRLNALYLNHCQVPGESALLDVTIQAMLGLTELNLATTHVENDINFFSALAKLKVLRKLSLPHCAFFKGDEHSSLPRLYKKVKVSKKQPFQMITESYKQLHELEIGKCYQSGCKKRSPTDTDLHSMHQLTKLQVLTLNGLSSLKSLSFLVPVFKNKQMKCLKLKEIGPASACRVVEALSLALKHAETLQSLSFTHPKFYINNKSFWDVLGSCPSLIHICVNTKVIQFANGRSLYLSLRPLQLQLLHIHYSTFYEEMDKKMFGHIPDLVIGTDMCYYTREDMVRKSLRNNLCHFESTIARHYPFL